MANERLLLNSSDMRRALLRMSHEIVEHYQGAENLMLVGLHRRGVPLAARLASCIADLESSEILIGSLDINLYRDDLTSRPQPLVRPTTMPASIDSKKIILVDDVLFTGRSIRSALAALVHHGRPNSVQLAVLIDRGHRELPIRADYVGKNVPTSTQEIVEVRVSEIDGKDEVAVVPISERRNNS